MFTKYEYFYNDFIKSNSGLNLEYWYQGGLRQVINRLIEFETVLLWKDEYVGDNGPQLKHNDDRFVLWLNEHHAMHKEHDECDFDWGCSNWQDEVFPNNNTQSPIDDSDQE